MLRILMSVVWFMVFVTCSGCVASQRVVTADPSTTALTFIKVGDDDHGYKQLYEAADSALSPSSDEKTYVQNECGITKPAGTKVLRVSVGEGILGAFVGGLMKLFTGAISAELEKKIKEYSAAYSATEVVDFYDAPTPGNEATISTPYRCFRFVRVVTGDDTKAQAMVDFVGRIDISADQTGLVIAPLRLYVAKTIAKTSKDDKGELKHGFALGMVAKSSWRDGNSGSAGEVFTAVLATEEIQVLPNKPYLKYFKKPDNAGNLPAAKLALLSPIIPYSVGSSVPPQARGRAAFEVRAAETGTPPDGLVFFSKLFAESSDAIAELLAASINKRLGFAEDD